MRNSRQPRRRPRTGRSFFPTRKNRSLTRASRRRRLDKRDLKVEALEERQLLATFELMQVQPNEGNVLNSTGIVDVRHVAPSELVFVFGVQEQIDQATVADGLKVRRVDPGPDNQIGTNDDVSAEVTPGYVGVRSAPNENKVVFRFGEPLPDAVYYVDVLGSLQNQLGEAYNDGNDTPGIRKFELDLGAQVVAVVAQPISRNATTGALSQARGEIVVYFNDDNLSASVAEQTQFYQLIDTQGTADTSDDPAAIYPTGVTYDPATDTAVLDFGADLATFGTGAFRLRIGNQYETITTSTQTVLADAADTFELAAPLGTLSSGLPGEGLILTGAAIEPDDANPYALEWPGGTDEPGHRELPGSGLDDLYEFPPPLVPPFPEDISSIEDHYIWDNGEAYDQVDGISTATYDFRETYAGYLNVITDEQKDRVREIFELFNYYFGVQFAEWFDPFGNDPLADMGVATADPAMLGTQGGPGGVAGVGGSFSPWLDGSVYLTEDAEAMALILPDGMAVMDAAEDWGLSQFGGEYFQVAMHEIMHVGWFGHSYDLPDLTIMGSSEDGEFGTDESEPVFPGDNDLAHALHMYRPDSRDIDLYSFTLDQPGTLSVETIAERLSDYTDGTGAQRSSSLLNSAITLFDSNKRVIARNDDYWSDDAFVELDLPEGNYYVGVTASGNVDYDPNIPDSGIGGRTQGEYDLRLTFRPEGTNHLSDETSTLFDGDYNGLEGGVYNYWFDVQAQADTIYVDKTPLASPSGPLGSITNPFAEIDLAFANAVPGNIVRIVGNNFENDDPDNPDSLLDNQAYEIGQAQLGATLVDGRQMNVPRGVTVMIDEGALFKLRDANVNTGTYTPGLNRSGGALQVLGTPEHNVVFTSYHNEARGNDSEDLDTTAAKGDWGGLVFRSDLDRQEVADENPNYSVAENEGIFLNYVNHAHIEYGGGEVRVSGVRGRYAPIHLAESRVTATFNTITLNQGAAISADPNSFEESQFQDHTYTADYRRVGPEIYHNTLVENSINGLFVRIDTEAGQPIDELEVPARFDDRTVTHVISETLIINSTPGGPTLDRLTYITQVDPITGDPVERFIAREDARLSIDPGVTVKLDGSRIETEISATFIAEGTPENPIIFTSLLDDRFGAGGTFDTNSDDDAPVEAEPEPGNWAGLNFGPVSRASIDHARIHYAGGETSIEGGFAYFAPIEVRQAVARITNTLFQDNTAQPDPSDRNGRGDLDPAVIFVRGAQPVIAKNTFKDNLGPNSPVISIDVNALKSFQVADWGRSTGEANLLRRYASNVGPLVRENVMSNNTYNAMEVRGGGLTTQVVWDDTHIVHMLRDEIVVPNFHTYGGLRLQSSASDSLIVKLDGNNAGFTATGRPLEIDDRIGGTIHVLGTAGHPVVLTSLDDDTAGNSYNISFDANGVSYFDTNNDGQGSGSPGDWRSVRLEKYSNDRNVDIVLEMEKAFGESQDQNGDVDSAQILGELTDDEKRGLAQEITEGDDNLRLGYEIHGNVRFDDTSDADVYAFSAPAGTVVWFDIDRTTHALDPVLELIDGDGVVLSRSDNSELELNDDETWDVPRRTMGVPLTAAFVDAVLAGTDNDMRFEATQRGPAMNGLFIEFVDTGAAIGDNAVVTFAGDTLTIDIDTFVTTALTVVDAVNAEGTFRASLIDEFFFGNDGSGVIFGVDTFGPTTGGATNMKDFYTTNQRDAGMRVVLPGPYGQVRTYYVRVRSAADPLDPAGPDGDGITKGSYQLQIRLQSKQEFPGSTVRYADIRYATNGIEVLGLPDHSPLQSELADSDTFGGGSFPAQVDAPLPGENNNLFFQATSPGAAFNGVTIDIVSTGAVTGDNAVVTYDGAAPSLTIDIDLTATTSNTVVTEVNNEGTFWAFLSLSDANNDGSGLVGTTASFGPTAGGAASGNDIFATPQIVGNLLGTDRNTINVSGYLGGLADVDWYRMEIALEGVQGISAEGSRWPTMFDIDYADGLSRPAARIWVFDASGNLVLTGLGGNIADDNPGPQQGSSMEDLSRGSFGGGDGFAGPIEMIEGDVFYVAVTGPGMVPDALNQGLIRREPIESVKRVMEDHILQNTTNFTTGDIIPVETSQILYPDGEEPTVAFPGLTAIEVNTYAEEFNLGDVVTFVLLEDTEFEHDLYTIDPFTGAWETDVTDAGSGNKLPDSQTVQGSPYVGYGDIAMRNDGRLYTFTQHSQTGGTDRNAWSGIYRELDTGDARTALNEQDDGIVTYQVDPQDPNGVNLIVRGDGNPNFELGGIDFEAMIHGLGNNNRGVLAVGNYPSAPGNVPFQENLLYRFDDAGNALDHRNGDGSERLPTNIVPMASLTTGAQIVAIDATDTTYPWPPGSPQYNNQAAWPVEDLLDATTITLEDADGTVMVFEFDLGLDIRFDPTGPQAVRDGESFMLQTETERRVFEFDSGPVLVLGDANTLHDGDIFTIQDNTTGNNANAPVTFQFVDTRVDPATPVPTAYQKIEFNGNEQSAAVITAVIDAINGAGFDVGATGFAVNNAVGRVSLTDDVNVQLGIPVAGTHSVAIDGWYGVAANNIAIDFEETNAEDAFGMNVVNVINNQLSELRVGYSHRTGEPGTGRVGDRLTIYGAIGYDIGFGAPPPLTPGSIYIDQGPADGNNDMIITSATAANPITVEFVDTGAVVGDLASISFNAFTGAWQIDIDAGVTTAGTVVTAINTHPTIPASAVLDLTFEPTNDGTGLMTFALNEPIRATGVSSFIHVDDANTADPALSELGVGQSTYIPIVFDADDTWQDINSEIVTAIDFARDVVNPQFSVAARTVGSAVSIVGLGANPIIFPAGSGLTFLGSADAPGGLVTGMAWIGNTLYAVSDEGGLYTIDLVSNDILGNDLSNYALEPIDEQNQPKSVQLTGGGTSLTYVSTADDLVGIEFTGLTAGPPNVEDGAYANILFATTADGELYAFDTTGALAPVFLDGATSVQMTDDLGFPLTGAKGIAFSTLDYNLWHVTNYRGDDTGHGVTRTFNHSRWDPDSNGYPREGGTSFYFGLEDPRPRSTISVQPNAADYQNTNPGVYYTYDLPGGAHGTLTTEPFSLVGYSPADQPTLYFNYFLDTENNAYFDSARVYYSTDGANWDIVASNTDRDDPYVGGADLQDDGAWRQAKISLAALAGEENIRLRFDFSTASNLNVGDAYREDYLYNELVFPPDGQFAWFDFEPTGTMTTGAYLMGVAGTEIDDTDTITLDAQIDFDVVYLPDPTTAFFGEVAEGGYIFEFDMGVALYMPNAAGAAIADREWFTVEDLAGNSVTFEFENPDDPLYTAGLAFGTVAIDITHEDSASDVAIRVLNAFVGAGGLVGITPEVYEDRVVLHGSGPVTQDANPLLSTVEVVGNGIGVTPGHVPIPVTQDMDSEQVAIAVATAIDSLLSNQNGRQIQAVGGGLLDDEMTFFLTTKTEDLFAVSNIPETETYVFEFEDLGVNNGTASPFNVDFNGGDAATTIATAVMQAINSAFIPGVSAFINPLTPDVVTLTTAFDTDVAFYPGTSTLTLLDGNDQPGTFTSVKVEDDLIRLIGHSVPVANPPDPANPGFVLEDPDFPGTPLLAPLSGPLPYSNFLPGDNRFRINPRRLSPENAQFHLFERGQDNAHEGFYIDDIIIGFTERGEMITNASADTGFHTVPVSPLDVLEGPYQLEVRSGEEYGFFPSPLYPNPPGTLELLGSFSEVGQTLPETIDTNDRLTQAVTLVAPPAIDIHHGQTFDIFDGDETVTFQFLGFGLGILDPDNVPIIFQGGETDNEMGNLIAAEINRYNQENPEFLVTAASSLGSPRVDLADAVNVIDLDAIFFDGKGDSNLYRDQGQVILESNWIRHSEEYGIVIDSAARDQGTNAPHPGSLTWMREPNTQRLVPSATIENNVIAYNGTGGILFSGDTNPASQPVAAVPFGRIVNNTIYGGVAGGVGVTVNENASPTLLNNILAGLDIGISVDGTSGSTVLGGTVFQNNNTDTQGIGVGSFELQLTAGAPLFRDPSEAVSNFYLEHLSPAIDSSLNSLQDRPAMTTMRDPVGIAKSPILAPTFDLYGQVRKDDDLVDPPPGLGSNIYKDRGAIDRVDFVGPTVALIRPTDDDDAWPDLDPRPTYVTVADEWLDEFTIQLGDSGIGIDDTTVTGDTVAVFQDGVELVQGDEYSFQYDSNNNVISLVPAGGWTTGHVYTIEFSDTNLIYDLGNNPLEPNRPTGETIIEITMETPQSDFGDAPAPYPTLLSDNGAEHAISAGFFLGGSVDTELTGQPSALADGDGADENGVTFLTVVHPTLDMQVNVFVTNANLTEFPQAYIDAWVDYNGNGVWEDTPEEHVLDSQLVNAGNNVLTIPVPDTFVPADHTELFARFRLSSTGGLDPTGRAEDGEVEDYRFLSNPWHNPDPATDDISGNGYNADVDGSGLLTSQDLIYLWSFLRFVGAQVPAPYPGPDAAPLPPNAPPNYYDVNGDNGIDILDLRAMVLGNMIPDLQGKSAPGQTAAPAPEAQGLSKTAVVSVGLTAETPAVLEPVTVAVQPVFASVELAAPAGDDAPAALTQPPQDSDAAVDLFFAAQTSSQQTGGTSSDAIAPLTQDQGLLLLAQADGDTSTVDDALIDMAGDGEAAKLSDDDLGNLLGELFSE